jgi:hypothetical protein
LRRQSLKQLYSQINTGLYSHDAEIAAVKCESRVLYFDERAMRASCERENKKFLREMDAESAVQKAALAQSATQFAAAAAK